MIALVDCNNFYCSCERVFQPRLRNRPLVVLSNNDGCIVARSNEVKAIGIAMGTPLFKAAELIRKHRIAVRSSNYALYGDMSSRVMRTLEQLCPEVEIYSIDEAFAYLDGIPGDLAELGRNLRATVLRHTGIPVSVGIGQTKTLAKIANKLAKNDLASGGVYILQDCRDEALSKLPVGDIWGIGSRYARMLNRSGIKTAADLRDASPEWVPSKMTVTGLRTMLELRGQRCIPPEMEPPPNKQIVRSRSFGRPVESLEQLTQAVALHASRGAEKLRQQHLAAEMVAVFITTNRFKDEPQYDRSVCTRLAIASDATDTIIAAALTGLRHIYRRGYRFKKAGIMLMGLIPAAGRQPVLFEELQCPQSSRTDAVLDAINRRFGPNTLRHAVMGFDNSGWAMRQSRRSPHYTTRWSELPVVKATA